MTTREQAIGEFGAGITALRQERDQLFADSGGGWEGAMAVGTAAHPHDPQRAEEVARKYLGWHEHERAKREPGAA